MASPSLNPPFISPCGSTTPPNLPDKFHAIALLTPFTGGQLVVADIYYDWSVQAMRITTYGLENGYGDFLYTPDGYYVLDSENGGDPSQCFGPIATTEQVPAPNWLANYHVTCNGVQEVLGVDTNWWCDLLPNNNPAAPIPPTPCPNIDSANWFWMRTDNQLPWRMMFINTTNDYKLPFIGRFAFIHFPTFMPVTQTNLPTIIQECIPQSARVDQEYAASLQIDEMEDTYDLLSEKPFLTSRVDRTAVVDQIQQLIPGLTPPTGNEAPPTWPDTLFMTALTTPTFEPHPFPNQPYPTQIYYDWTNHHQLTRFFLPDTSLEDVILTSTTSYLIARFTDGTHKCLGTVPVGLPFQNWPTHEGTCTCKGVITNNPQLSPNKTTQIFTKDSQPPRHFWFWYTTTNEAVMFAEVPQACNVELILTDYFNYIPNPPPFDPSLFVVPPDCISEAVQPVAAPIKKSSTRKATKKVVARKPSKKIVAAKSSKKAAGGKAVRNTALRKSNKKTVVSNTAKKSRVRKLTRKTVTVARKTTKRTSTSKVSRRPKSNKK